MSIVNSEIERIFVPSQLQSKIMELLDIWLPTYLREIQLQMGNSDHPALPEIRSFTTRNEFDKFPEDQLPMCVVVSPGLASEPIKRGDGRYQAWFAIGVGVVVSARTQAETEELAKIYTAAVRAILLQHPDILGYAAGVEWADESYDDLVDTDQERSLRAGQVIFRVMVDNVVTAMAGPIEPLPEPEMPGRDWPDVESVHVETRLIPHGE